MLVQGCQLIAQGGTMHRALKWIGVIVGLVMLTSAAACVKSATLALEGPDSVSTNVKARYVATVSNAPPTVGTSTFLWGLDYGSERYIAWEAVVVPVEQTGTASSWAEFNAVQLREWFNQRFSGQRMPSKVTVGVLVVVASQFEAETAELFEQKVVTIR